LGDPQVSEAGGRLLLLQDNLESIAEAASEPSPPIRKVDELVLYVGRKAPVLNEPAFFIENYSWPVVRARGTSEMAAIRSLAVGELGYLAQSPQGFRLTVKGWERFAALDAERPKSTSAFVAMAFHSEMTPAYDDGIKPALYALGYDPLRVDRDDYLGKIDDYIIASIRKSSLVVADFTRIRPGVFFEAGLALGLGASVVWTCREDEIEEIGKHFDTRQYNHLAWSDPADLKTKLRNRIEASVIGRPKPRTKE
jgi:hypothetical protein